jgi:hypothetical protein
MSNPLTPLFPMENKKGSVVVPSFPDERIKEHIKGVIKPIFDKVLKEISKNPMWVGKVGVDRVGFVFYQPHNYRLFFEFSKENFKPSKPTLEGGLGGLVVTKRNHDSELVFRFINDCEIVVKKRMVEVRNFVEHKRWYKVSLGEGAEGEVLDIVRKKDAECVEALKRFISVFGGSCDFVIRNRFSEDKISAEDFIDGLPLKLKFKNDVAKKVYNEGNVEFKSPILASNYIRNQALEAHAPEIIERLRGVEESLKSPLERVKGKIRGFDDVFRLRIEIGDLCSGDRDELGGWLIERFGFRA